MNRDEIMQLAQKAGFNTDHNMISVEGWEIFPYMQRFADLVAAAERNACMSACRQVANACTDSTDALSVGINHGAISCAIAIELREARNEQA